MSKKRKRERESQMKIVVNKNLDEIYRTYSTVLYKICLRYASCEAEAEDILHDSFIRIYERLPQYKGTGSFEGWLKRVVVSVALNKLRTNRFTPKFHEDFDTINESNIQIHNESQPDENREKLLNAQLTHRDVLTCMQQLPTKAKAIFNLYVFEEKKHKEIAKELGITTSTSKTQLKRARFLLNELLLKHSEMKIKNLKKLSIFAIFIRKDNYAFIDGFVKKSINNAEISAPQIDMESIVNTSRNIGNATTGAANTGTYGNMLSQAGAHIKGNILAYSLSSVIATAVTVGVISMTEPKPESYNKIELIEPRTIQLNIIESDGNKIINEMQHYAPIKAAFDKKPIIEQNQTTVPDTVTQYERVRLIDTLK